MFLIRLPRRLYRQIDAPIQILSAVAWLHSSHCPLICTLQSMLNHVSTQQHRPHFQYTHSATSQRPTPRALSRKRRARTNMKSKRNGTVDFTAHWLQGMLLHTVFARSPAQLTQVHSCCCPVPSQPRPLWSHPIIKVQSTC